MLYCSQTGLMMQDTLLRVFAVCLTLLVYPRNEPGVEEWEDNTIVGVQKNEERLQRGREGLDRKTAPVIPEETQSYQQDAERDEMSVSDFATIFEHKDESGQKKLTEHQYFLTDVDLSWLQESKTEPENSPNDHEPMREDIQTGLLKETIKSNQQTEKEALNSKVRESSVSHARTRAPEKESPGKAIPDWERDYLWYIFSIISLIRFFKNYLGRALQNKQLVQPFSVTCSAAEMPLPDSNTLQRFHSKWIQTSSDKKCLENAFLEGFASDLIEAMRTICDKSGSVVIEDFQMVNVCTIIVPFGPSDPYDFQCQLCNNQQSDRLELQLCGQIKLVENEIQNGCPCQSDADTVCLLHCETEKRMKSDVFGDLCKKDSFLLKSQVTKLFRGMIKQAWALISHKYEFELNIPYIDAPGALFIRFRSGKKISFTLNPVVKFNTDAYFVITPCTPNNLDSFWMLSLSHYEDRFIKQMSKCLPENSCYSQTLDIAHFLHKRQTALSGSSALKDSHLKMALMHLLLTRDPSEWKPDCMTRRLRDLLDFVERSLERKALHHVLIGNPLVRKVIELPAEFSEANAVNLFHPLVVHNCIYRNAVMHFQEIVRNAHMLISDYVNRCSNTEAQYNTLLAVY